MTGQFEQIEWNAAVEDDCRQLIRLAVREDLDRHLDWTTASLIPSGTPGEAAVVCRAAGVVSGLRAAELVLDEMDSRLQWRPRVADGTTVQKDETLATIAGPARSLLAAERTLLNFIGRLSGIASLTRSYVDAVSGTKARIFDTRKTTPGWRRLEKYAVRCGGGCNHRMGLFDAILIKDNHLALSAGGQTGRSLSPAEAVGRARKFLDKLAQDTASAAMPLEVEVDSLEQLSDVLPVGPDIVLLDNMSIEQLRQAVNTRDRVAPNVELEASGGVRLDSVAAIAATGVERISVGALTHSATSLDVGLDWR